MAENTRKKISPELRLGKAMDAKLDRLARALEKSGIEDYLEYRRSPRRVIASNFLGGLARGFGMAIGFTILGAVVIWLLQRAALESLPVIGEFIAEIVSIVKDKL